MNQLTTPVLTQLKNFVAPVARRWSSRQTPLDWLVNLLEAGRGIYDSNPGRDGVDNLTHGLQVATFFERSGAGDAEVVMGLVHDAAKPLSMAYHGEVIAEVMRGRLPDPCVEVLRTHGIFQDDFLRGRQRRGRFLQEPWFDLALRLARWEPLCFCPGVETPPLEHFIPRLAAFVKD